MPHDLDEDESAPLDLPPRDGPPPRPAAAGPRQPAAPAPPAGPRALRWGVCGVLDQAGDLVTVTGGTGVVRYVIGGVGYTAPPAGGTWKPVPAEPGRYEMPWDGDPAAARTLRGLRSELELAARGGRFASPRDPLLAEVDAAAAALTTLAGKLHRQRWSLGLIQPDNVVLRPRGGDVEAVLPDLGFAWKGSFGSPPWDDNPGRPDWLNDDAQPTWLWDHDPVRQQFADPGNGVFPPADPAGDVRTLGRLLTWLVSGHAARDATPVSNPPPVWAVLSDAVNGTITSAEMLAARLREAPLSGYLYRPPAPTTGKPGGSGIGQFIVGGLVLAAVAAGVGGWFYLNQPMPPPSATESTPSTPTPSSKPSPPTKPSPPATPSPPTKPDPAAPDLTALLKRASVGSLADRFKALVDLSKLSNLSADQKAAAAAARDKVRADWLVELKAAVKDGEKPDQRIKVARRLAKLRDQMAQLTANKAPGAPPAQTQEEKRCLTIVEFWCGQFGSPR